MTGNTRCTLAYSKSAKADPSIYYFPSDSAFSRTRKVTAEICACVYLINPDIAIALAANAAAKAYFEGIQTECFPPNYKQEKRTRISTKTHTEPQDEPNEEMWEEDELETRRASGEKKFPQEVAKAVIDGQTRTKTTTNQTSKASHQEEPKEQPGVQTGILRELQRGLLQRLPQQGGLEALGKIWLARLQQLSVSTSECPWLVPEKFRTLLHVYKPSRVS